MNKNEKEEKRNSLFKDIVIRFSKESHCESKKVAALAVKNGRIIATGINGTPEGQINCDEYFKEEYKKRNILIPYEEWIKTKEWRDEHHEWSNNNEVHAEQALICEAGRNGINLTNIDIYISLEPCIHCAKLLAALKPKNIFYVNNYDKSKPVSKQLLNKCGIIIKKIK
jgi:dCMP deaminase